MYVCMHGTSLFTFTSTSVVVYICLLILMLLFIGILRFAFILKVVSISTFTLQTLQEDYSSRQDPQPGPPRSFLEPPSTEPPQPARGGSPAGPASL